MDRPHILVTGTKGQVVQALVERGREAGTKVTTLGRPNLDLSNADVAESVISEALATLQPDVVVNAAAYTAVDRAEDEPELAMAINGAGAGAVALAAARAGRPIIHLSTDYVFDGTKLAPYVETDPTAPLGAYGRSKLAGEHAVASANPRHIIVRTAWVYGPHGANFLKTMLRVSAERDEVSVVMDQVGNPTCAMDIADGLLAAVGRVRSEAVVSPVWGQYHLTGSGSTSWEGFASYIFEESAKLGGPKAHVIPITTIDWPSKAARPANSRMNCSYYRNVFRYEAPNWKDSCKKSIHRLLDKPY